MRPESSGEAMEAHNQEKEADRRHMGEAGPRRKP